jgi:hypothetical protein
MGGARVSKCCDNYALVVECQHVPIDVLTKNALGGRSVANLREEELMKLKAYRGGASSRC